MAATPPLPSPRPPNSVGADLAHALPLPPPALTAAGVARIEVPTTPVECAPRRRQWSGWRRWRHQPAPAVRRGTGAHHSTPPPPPPARLLTGRDRHTYHTLPLGSEKTPKKDRRKNRTAARVFLSQAAEPRCHAANRGRLPAPRHPPHLGPVPPPPLPLPSLPPPGPRCRHQRHVIRGVRHARLNERLPGYGCTCKPDTAKVKATTRTRVAAPRPKRRNDTRLLADSAATSGRRCTWPGQGTPPSPPSPPPPPTPRAEVRNNRARRWWQSASRTCGQAAVQKRREKQSAPRGVAASAWSPGGGGAYHSTTTPIPCPPHPSLPPPPLRPAVATRASCVGTCCVPCDAAAKRRPEASPDATHAIARQHSADALAAGKAGRDGG